MESRVAPYGSWKSPITAALTARAGVQPGALQFSGADLFRLEFRPEEQGRVVLVRKSGDGPDEDLTPEGYSVRSLVHEYGGGAYCLDGETVFFSNFSDQRIYCQPPGGEPRPITPEPERPRALRYADGRIVPGTISMICVRESHGDDGAVANELVSIPVDGSSEPRVIASGRDFYSFPRPSPGGRRLAWTTWDHPQMPWDGTELWVGELDADGSVANARRVAGGVEESIFQPAWSPGGLLHFVSDRTGWWNLYRLRDDRIEPLCPMEAEFGLPQWGFGLSCYDFLGDGRIVCAFARRGADHLGLLDTETGELEEVETGCTSLGFGDVASDGGKRVAFVGGSPTQSLGVIGLDADDPRPEVLWRSRAVDVDPGYLSRPRTIEFPTEGNLTAHAYYYPPANRDFRAPEDEKAPLLVLSHGGPTSHTSTELRPAIQFWTSRGFAVVDVDYGGSSGHGRAYRSRLEGGWGIVDATDCVRAALYLAGQERVDPNRMAIRGGSAGGYTTLCALTFHDVFRAGASYYGVGDLEALARETHKFESRYLDGLVGPYPKAAETYRKRSPIHFTEKLSCPVIFFQGLDDKVVAPSQATRMRDALRAKGVPVAYLPFEGEDHGFRRAETLVRSLEAELYFYSRVFRFEPADEIEPVPIDNSDG